MDTQSFIFQVNLPSVDDFAARYPQYGSFARHEGAFLYHRLVSPDAFISAKVATEELDLPAVAGVARLCYQTVSDNGTLEWSGFIKQFIGAVVCKLMEENGFEKTGTKRAIPHFAFTKGEFYQRKGQGSAHE